ncbi:MAG: DUF368 domain-containing protein [Bacilli bacterium]
MINKIKGNIYTFFVGIIMGIANIIPGVSGGTIAVGLGIFDKLITSINTFFKNPKKTLPFLIPLAMGMIVGILIFSGIISFSLENYSFATNMFFVGLVVSSIPLIINGAKDKNFKKKQYIYTIIGSLIVIILTILENNGITNSSENNGYIKLLISGAIASSSMIIPGISGSFMMILLGIYDGLLIAISTFKDWLLNISDTALLIDSLKVIAPLGIGIVIGIILISKLIEFLFKNFQSQTYLVILGLIFGSIFSILVSNDTYASGINFLTIIIGIIMLVLGYLLGTIFIKKDSN